MEKVIILNEQRAQANKDFVEFLKACPHVVPSNIGIEEFERQLESALDKWVVFNTKTMQIDPVRYLQGPWEAEKD